MYEVRQIIVRLRSGESDRGIARSQRVGRATVSGVRRKAQERGWLDPAGALPDDAQLAAVFKGPRQAPQNVSSAEPFRESLLAWHSRGIAVSTMHRALVRQHGYAGSVHALYRFFERVGTALPVATVVLDFPPAECAQVDFGQGPRITDRHSGEVIASWIFVMTLAWSRHQYAEIVPNQRAETWLGCHRRAFEWFNGVPLKIAIDNTKCAITRACYYEPTVQRAYGELHWDTPFASPHVRRGGRN